MTLRLILTPTSWLLRFAAWIFGPAAAGVDMLLAGLSVGWAILMVAKPDMFDRGSYEGLALMPDPAWIGLFWALSAAHGLGLVHPGWRHLRTGSALVSAWAWIFVAVCLGRAEITTGVVAYGLIGVFALLAGIYVQGLAPTEG